MVNLNTIERLIDDIESDHEIEILTDSEVSVLFHDHGCESDIAEYLDSVRIPALASALEFLGY